MASLKERTTGAVTQRIVVRWREGGHGSRQRWKTFPATKQGRADARFFKASIERAQSLGQMASELIGSEQTLREFTLE